MSRLESGIFGLKPEWTDVNELIFSVIHQFTAAKNHQIIFDADEKLPLMRFDGVLMGQILYNLVHNAVIYTPDFSTIKLGCSLENDFSIIQVIDDGNGFPENEIPFVFDKFYRLPNSKTGGSGLGLSISKGYVEAHNGTIELRNNEDRGAVFTLKIPVESSYINNLKNE
ncbi:sensor histidine kinase [Kaistella montana]|uniref:histidine kinase n=1 Tax=Kaistella montana TaxID=1849733 RepID=A0ABW5K8Z7_9FLAO|nr:ATP-binding protein [Kaistella montana]MCQ4035004.1 ATP-binding protein [Kaistella montana]